jgi:HAD superfamily hydrolase (TIGR01509 family)
VLSEPFTAAAAIAMFAEKGFTVSPEEFRPFIGAGEDRFIGGVAAARGIPLDPVRDKSRTYAIYLEQIRGRLEALPGARDFVESCGKRGLSLAVASGSDAIKVEANLRELGLPRALFAAIVTGSEVERKKPAPDIFLEACARLRLEPAACLVVEDAVNGVRAAKATGARCLGVTTSFSAEDLAEADWIAPDLAHVPGDALDW